MGIRAGAASLAAMGAVALIPLWWHITVIDRGVSGIIAVFSEVGVYPSDVCLALLAVIGVSRPPSLDRDRRWLVLGFVGLAFAVALSSLQALDGRLAIGLAAQLALLSLAWLGLKAGGVSRTTLAAALVASAVLQSALAAAQFVIQQPLIPDALQLPWLPTEASAAGTPVILDAAGDRLFRGFGTFPHPNVLGGYLALALVGLPLLGRRWPDQRMLWHAAGGILGIGLLASFSRAGWLAAIVGLGFWWLTGQRQRRDVVSFAAMTALACTAIGASPLGSTIEARLFPLGPDSNALERGSIENRLALDRESLDAIANHLPLGVGAGNYGMVAMAEGRDDGWGEPAPNIALLIATELGLPGVLALALVIFGMARVLRQRGHFDAAPTAAFLALVVLSLFDHYLWTMPLGRVIAWVPFALVSAANRQKSGPAPPGLPERNPSSAAPCRLGRAGAAGRP